MKKWWMVLSLGLLFVALPVRAGDDDDEKKMGDKQIRELLKQVDTATKEVNGVSYDAEFFVEGGEADQAAKIVGKVKTKRGKSGMLGGIMGSSISPLRVEGEIIRPGSDTKDKFLVATNGKDAYNLNAKDKVLVKGEMPDAAKLIRVGFNLLQQEFVHPTPFSDEIGAKTVKYEGEKEIGDVKCDVVYVIYGMEGAPETRWFFGKEDHLVRRCERIVTRDDQKVGRVLEITNLEVDPKFGKGTFVLKAPEGYATKEFDEDEEEEEKPAELLAVGAKAPNFELKTPDGKEVSLESLKGKIVVMDFWATWCGPCKMAMPGVQKLHEQFKDKPVKVIGMNCWERGGDPAKYMKSKSYTYGLLLKADGVAEKYKVKSIPTFYVIDPEGKILLAKEYEPGLDKEISKVVDKAIKEADL